METVWQDIQFGVRQLLKTPSFAAVSVLTLALGIGANTAIFSVVNTILLRPLPYENPDRLVVVWEKNLKKGWKMVPVSYLNFTDLRDSSKVCDSMGAYIDANFNLTGGDEPERVTGLRVSSSIFSMVGVNALHGRTFVPADDELNASRVLIISYGLWQRRFGSKLDLVGQTVALDTQTYTVVGIMPPGFSFPPPFSATVASSEYVAPNPDLWVPLRTDAVPPVREVRSLYVVARLKPGASIEQAQSEMNTLAANLDKEYPATNTGLEVTLVSLPKQVVGDTKTPLLLLLLAVALVLLIACANVGNLLLVKATARRKEIAMRTALGATRFRLMRQLITESLLLSIAGGVIGLLLALIGVRQLAAFSPDNLARLKDVTLDGRVLIFTLLVSVITAVIFGLAPALQASRTDLNETLKEGGKGSAGPDRSRISSIFVVMEMALALMLLITAALMIRSFIHLQEVNPGFNPRNVTTLEIQLPESKYREGYQQAAFQKQLMESLKQTNGIQAAATVDNLPFSGNESSLAFNIEGRPAPTLNDRPRAFYRVVSSDYFRAMSIPLHEGRLFNDHDSEDAPPVALINDVTARRFWPGENPIGRRIKQGRLESKTPWVTIVGTIGAVSHSALDIEAQPEVYLPFLQNNGRSLTLVARSDSDPQVIVPAIRNQVRALDRDLPVLTTKPMEDIVARSLAPARFYGLLLGIFAALALLLAGVGIYGVISYSASQRTHEIGIRLALGAQRSDVLKLIVGRGMIMALIGIGIGLVGAFFITRFMSSLLFGVSATNLLTYAETSLLLAAIAFVACFVPARKATKVNPMRALRHE